MNGTALCEAVSNIDLARVTALLGTGHCANGVRDPGGENEAQPDRPLKMVLFRMSDCLLGEEQLATLAEIARVLLTHGADPKPAAELAEQRYGKYSKEDEKWKAWSVVVVAAATAPLGVGTSSDATSLPVAEAGAVTTCSRCTFENTASAAQCQMCAADLTTHVTGECIALLLDGSGDTVDVHPCTCPLCIEAEIECYSTDASTDSHDEGGVYPSDDDDDVSPGTAK